MSITKTRYSAASEAAVPYLEDYEPTNLDIIKLEISCIKGNRWLDAEEKREAYLKLKKEMAPKMFEHVFEALLK